MALADAGVVETIRELVEIESPSGNVGQSSVLVDRIVEIASELNTAIMCSEAVWWRCHRRIIADYLMLRGRRVQHLMSSTKMIEATMTPGAKEEDGRLVYPAAQ